MNAKELLPLGSVVSLKEGNRKLIVIGIKQFNAEKNTVKDYIGVLYPEGYINRDIVFTFDQEDISEISFEGYRSEEYEAFLEQVDKIAKREIRSKK